MLFVGIDIAKRNHEASVIAQDGSVVRKTMRFANSQAGYNKFMDIDVYKRQNRGRLRIRSLST